MSSFRSLSRHRLRLPLFLGLGALGFLSLGADGCNGYDNVSVDSETLAANSPDADETSISNPVIVMRDNPRLYGAIGVGAGVTGSPGGKYLTSGKWTNFRGTVQLLAHEPAGQAEHIDYGPLLPMKKAQGPEQAQWGSQFGDLLPGNVYRATLSVREGANLNHVTSNRPLWIKLSDDVMVVPVVAISWKKSAGPYPFGRDVSKQAKATFDFVPYTSNYEADFTPPLTYAQIENPNQPSVNMLAPDTNDLPPDELFSQCNIQFQLVASYVFELPADHKFGSCVTTLPWFEGSSSIRSRIAATGPRGRRIADALSPVFVSYGNVDPMVCAQTETGKRIPAQSLVEVRYARSDVTIAHELGHVLLDTPGKPTHYGQAQPENDNLMRPFPSSSATKLTADQCNVARANAKAYMDRFVAFNDTRGLARRPVRPVVRPDPLPTQNVCCESNGSHQRMTDLACTVKKGKVVDDSACKVCCVSGSGVASTFNDRCSADDRRPESDCERVCCTTDPDRYTPMSRYTCHSSGGKEVECRTRPPQ